jgi:serine phosphatase RsbU (regulator of sigma subunit)
LFAVSGLSAQTDFYWEAPALFSRTPGSFPVSASFGEFSVVAWQQTEANQNAAVAADGFISIVLAVKKPGQPWENLGVVGGPYAYSGTEPSILGIVIDNRGRIVIAAAASTTQTEILVSEDEGRNFSRRQVNMGSESSVAPRLYVRADGGYLLFVTRGNEQSLSIFYSRSDNAVEWEPFKPFVNEANLRLSFLPAHGSIGNTDFVFFQSFVGATNTIPAFQLYLKISVDSGRTWTSARRFTDFRDPVMNTNAEADSFDNQRPFVMNDGDGLFLVWERRFRIQSPQIYGARIGINGNIIGSAEQINSDEAYCKNPIAFHYDGEPLIIWFDNRRGENRIFLARQEGINWRNYDLSGAAGGDASFARPIVDAEDGLFVFWQTTERETGRIYSLFPDRSVNPPRLSAVNFDPARRSRAERVRLSWNVPRDSSGILGFSWIWTQNENAAPPEQIMIYNTGNVSQAMDLNAVEDGSWYFFVRARDFAGNWSAPGRIEYIKDTTPPPAANIIQPETDDQGFLLSNDLALSWNPPPASDVAGYTWNLQFIGDAESFDRLILSGNMPALEAPPSGIRGTGNSASYANQDDGVWAFSVAAIDDVGNIGPRSSIFFKTDKYIPYTLVTNIDSPQDEQGILTMRIFGRGFSTGGNVARIFLDKDGQPPYDREFLLSRGDYEIRSDREITGLQIEDIAEGAYLVALDHSGRGLYRTPPIVAVDRKGTVKFGDYSRAWKPSWTPRAERSFVFESGLIIVAVLLVLCATGLIVSIRGIGSAIAEGAAVKTEALALITGDFMPEEKKKRVVGIRRRGISLRFKLASFTIVLVLMVVVMVSAPLYYMMTRTQRETLLQGLSDRSTVLLEGLASGARAYLPSGNALELGFLPAQTAAIPEARYVTITGFGTGSTIFNDHVWASNDPDILSKIDTAEFQPGVSRLQDILSPRLTGISSELNERARAEVGELSRNIGELTREALIISTRTDRESQQRLNDIQVTTRSLETRLTGGLAEIARQIGSEPEFSTEYISRDESRTYIFFKPVMYRQGSDDNYFRGLIRLEVTIDSILAEIASRQWSLLRIILIVALAAIAIGTIGALILSGLIIQPIRKLVTHVERIRDTDDKAKLEGVDIHISTHDEIAVLGNTINDMTHGLVKAAAAASDLSIGKEIQKKFIPLELDREGNKLSSGYKDTKNAHFFGYYEGAKGVSGDYFDYQDLDGRYYAIIKCDVAGKGIPAALIMIQVATMFLNYFKQWKPTAKGMHIEEVVYQINDFIETLGFKGRFAAFTLCLFDSQTGIVRFCNAGDNLIHLFDASEGRIKTMTLPETPATGVLPNFLVESKGGYTVQTLTIDHGDILLLYTDGIEEAKRKFRDLEFREIVCAEGEKDTPHGSHTVGQGDEEMGPERVQGIINAVMNREVYTLHKWHNPEGEEHDLKFDFSDCSGKVEEVIMALVSVEKMFRCYKNPKADDDSKVLVDKKADEFLKTHFLQYRNYCTHTREYPGNDAYMYYTHIEEDDQYDDLTILGIKRK